MRKANPIHLNYDDHNVAELLRHTLTRFENMKDPFGRDELEEEVRNSVLGILSRSGAVKTAEVLEKIYEILEEDL